MPETMKALVLTTAEAAAKVQDILIPNPKPIELLIKVHAVALNNVDAIYVAKPIASQPERVIGSDFAGEVVGVPEALMDSSDPRCRVGARVAGFLQGACSANDRPGAFAEYITPEHDLLWLIPDDISYEEASTVSLCAMTAAQGVFFRLGLPAPFHESERLLPVGDVSVFIYGASTSLGLYAAQWVQLAARVAGRKIRLIGAASSGKHELLRAAPYNYDALVDYRETNWVEQVKALTDGVGASFGIDCISECQTVGNVSSVLNDRGKYAVFRAPAGGNYSLDDLKIKPIYGAVWEALGVEIQYYNFTVPPNPKARDFATRLFNYFTDRAAVGEMLIEPNPARLMPGGLNRIAPDGLHLLGSGVMISTLKAAHMRAEDYMMPISAEKLVYTVL